MESSSTIQILNLLNKLVDAAQYGQQIIQDAPHKMQALQDQTDQFITNYNQFKMQTQDDLYHRNSLDVNVDDNDDDNGNKSSREFSLNSSSVVRPLCYVSFNPPINVNFSLDSNGSMHEEILKIVNHLIELFSTNINQMKSFRDVVNTHATKLKELMRRSNRMYSLVGTNNSIRGYMATPVKEAHIVSGYAYTVMRILDIVASTGAATLSPRDFQERKNVYIEQLKSSSVSQDFIDFLSKLTQTNAKSMLTRHYSLLTPNSVSRLYNIILTEWLVCNNYYTSLESGYHAVNFKIMPDFIRNNMKNLQSTIEEFVTTNYSQLAEDNTLPQTLNRRVESIIKLTQKDEENFVNSILKGRGGGGDDDNDDDKNVVDNELLQGGRTDESSKKTRGGNVVAFKPKNTTTMENKRENVYQQIKNKLVWLNTLISPLGTLYSATTSPAVEFSFLTTTNTDWNSNITDYTDNELKIEDFYGNMGNFKSFWSHLHTLFDASCLEKFNAIIYEYAPNLVKSLFLVNQTLHLNVDVNTTDGNNNGNNTNETTLYSACKKFSIFPCELSFRDGGFIVQYLIILKKVKSSNHQQHVLANLSTIILAYLDSFCLEPHVQLLAMYALGLFKRFVLGKNQIGGVHKEVHFTISNLLNGKSDLTLENRQLIISLAFCHFLDLIFKMTNDGLLQATTTSSNLASNASEQYRADLKHYGTVYFPTLEDFVNNLPSLAAFSHAYELSIPASMFSHANENILLRDQSQTALVSQLFMDEITPLGFFKACPEHVYNLNRIIAESIYMSHVKRKQYSLTSSLSSDVDETTNSTNKNLKRSLKNMEKDLKKYRIDKGVLFAQGDLLCEMKEDENDLELTKSTTLTFTLFTLKRANREYRFINVYLADMSQIQPHEFTNALTLEQMFIYPLSFFLNMGQGLVLKNFFSTNLNRSPPIVGNSNSTRFNSTYDEEKSKFIIVTLKPLPESFARLVENITTNYCERLVPACEYNTYMLSDKLPDEENYKLVRVNNDLYSVACDLDLEWMFNLLSSLNTTNVVFNVVEPTRKLLNFKFYRQDGKKHNPSDDDDTNNRRLFVLNRAFASSSSLDVEQQQQQQESGEDLLNFMLKNMNGDDILAVNNSLLSKLNAQGRERGEFSSAGADISLLKSQQKLNDWEQILTNNAQNAWKSLEYAASRSSPTQELINNMPMHQTLGALSTEMSNPEIYQLLVMNRRKAESLLENGVSSIMQWLEKAKKIDVDLANVVVANKSTTSNDESRVSSSTIMKYHELLIKAQDDLKTTLNNYQEYCNLNIHVMNIMMLNAERVLFSLIALIHFYSNVHMYILDEMFYSKYAYTESFQSRDSKSAGMYVHVHDFLLWANNHANFENLPSCVGLVLYHLAINVPTDKPFIYMFQSVNIFKTPMIPTYPAIICLFIAHLLEQDASI